MAQKFLSVLLAASMPSSSYASCPDTVCISGANKPMVIQDFDGTYEKTSEGLYSQVSGIHVLYYCDALSQWWLGETGNLNEASSDFAWRCGGYFRSSSSSCPHDISYFKWCSITDEQATCAVDLEVKAGECPSPSISAVGGASSSSSTVDGASSSSSAVSGVVGVIIVLCCVACIVVVCWKACLNNRDDKCSQAGSPAVVAAPPLQAVVVGTPQVVVQPAAAAPAIAQTGQAQQGTVVVEGP